jgi:hypothetical protein
LGSQRDPTSCSPPRSAAFRSLPRSATWSRAPSPCDGDLEHDIITSPLLAVERPSRTVAAVPAQRRGPLERALPSREHQRTAQCWL